MSESHQSVQRFFCCFPIGRRNSRRNNRIGPTNSQITTRAFTGFAGNTSSPGTI